MKILFDQGTPAPLRSRLHKHTVVTAYEKKWDTLSNGDLIQSAEIEGFDLLVTTDKNLKYQQKLTSRKITIVVLLSANWPKIQKSATEVTAAIEGGAARRISRDSHLARSQPEPLHTRNRFVVLPIPPENHQNLQGDYFFGLPICLRCNLRSRAAQSTRSNRS